MLKAEHALICGFFAAGFAAFPVAAQTKPAQAPKQTTTASSPRVMQHMIGDKIQVYYEKWYPATIREVGKGDYTGFYRVAFDDFQRERWVDDDEVRSIPTGTNHPGAFLSGSYKCYRRNRPSKAQMVDELYLKPNGDYSMKDDLRVGLYMLGADNKVVFQGGGMDDADAHVEGSGQLHVIKSRHIHWGENEAQQLFCITG